MLPFGIQRCEYQVVELQQRLGACGDVGSYEIERVVVEGPATAQYHYVVEDVVVCGVAPVAGGEGGGLDLDMGGIYR